MIACIIAGSGTCLSLQRQGAFARSLTRGQDPPQKSRQARRLAHPRHRQHAALPHREPCRSRLRHGERHIWVFWHNRMFLIPWLRENLIPDRRAPFSPVPVATAKSSRKPAPILSSSQCAAAAPGVARRPWSNSRSMYRVRPRHRHHARRPARPALPHEHGRHQARPAHGREAHARHMRFDRALRLRTWDGFLLPCPSAVSRSSSPNPSPSPAA